MTASDPELFRNVLEGLHNGVYVMDRSGKILFWNDGAERIAGYLRQGMMGRVSQEQLSGADRRRRKRVGWRAIAHLAGHARGQTGWEGGFALSQGRPPRSGASSCVSDSGRARRDFGRGGNL